MTRPAYLGDGSRIVRAVIDEDEDVHIHLGCGRDVLDGWLNVDHVDAPGVDMLLDLDEQPWPILDNRVATVRMHNTLEHLRNPLGALREIARITHPNGLVDILVPHADSDAALQVGHHHTYDEDSLRSVCRLGTGTPGLDTPHLFQLLELEIYHRHPWAWHQRKHLGREILAWGRHQVRWILRPVHPSPSTSNSADSPPTAADG